MSKRPEWEEAEEAKQILKQKQQDSVEAEKTRMDRKAELLVLERRMQMERVETEMEEKVKKEREEVSSVREKQEIDERLATEMSRLSREEERAQKTREQLRNSSEELKILENKLRAAYVSKQLTSQIAEKEATAAQEKLEKLKIQELLEAENKCMEEIVRQKENSLAAEKLRYKEELLNQIREGNKKNQDKERDLVLEKALLKDAMRKFHEDEAREKATRLERLDMFRQEIKEFQRQKEIRKQSERIANEEEEKRLKAYADEKEKQEENRIKDLKEKEAMKNKIRDQINLSFLSKDQTAKEREDILAELAEEEIRQRDLKKDKEKSDAAENLKKDFQKAFKANLDEKLLGWKADYQEQEQYRHKLLDHLTKEEELEKSSQGSKARRSKELRESLLQQIHEKHKRQIEEWQRDSALVKLQEIEEKERLRIVEEERLNVLKKHAAKLIGYLPRDLIRESDLKHLGPEFIDKLSKYNSMNSS